MTLWSMINEICLKLVRWSLFLFRLINVHIPRNNCLWGEDDYRLFVTCMYLDGRIITFILQCITLFLTPRQPSLRKVQMERHTLPTGPMESFMGPNGLCGYICS